MAIVPCQCTNTKRHQNLSITTMIEKFDFLKVENTQVICHKQLILCIMTGKCLL